MLLDLWKANKSDLESKHIQQIVAIAGDGKLKDGCKCAEEVRAYLSQVEIDRIEAYINQCLETSFTDSGLVLQDLVNEVGRRLDFEVEDGLYQGRQKEVGFDGLWRAPEGFAIVVEVKTTDAYRITLDKIAGYRQALIKSGNIDEDSCILIVVGRKDTGDLEAQVRGSKHAWDIRIISADALLSLAKVKIASEEDTSEKMRQLLRPVEYTRLDGLVDVVYATSQDSEEIDMSGSDETESPSGEDTKKEGYAFTDGKIIDALRNRIIERFGALKHQQIVKRTKATYWSPDRALRVVCTLSKRYERESRRYWYAYHPAWDTFLEDARGAYLILGCVDLDVAFAIPRGELLPLLEHFHQTHREGGDSYWHLAIAEPSPENYQLLLTKKGGSFDLMPFIFPL